MKSSFSAGPIYVRREDKINAHFLICFISLTILRILEKETKLSNFVIQKAIKSATFKKLDNGYYAFSHISDNLNKLLKAFNVKIEYAYKPIEDIRKLRKKICIYINKD